MVGNARPESFPEPPARGVGEMSDSSLACGTSGSAKDPLRVETGPRRTYTLLSGIP